VCGCVHACEWDREIIFVRVCVLRPYMGADLSWTVSSAGWPIHLLAGHVTADVNSLIWGLLSLSVSGIQLHIRRAGETETETKRERGGREINHFGSGHL
jgi:hypothetical protein